jgi:hypothetical protein
VVVVWRPEHTFVLADRPAAATPPAPALATTAP